MSKKIKGQELMLFVNGKSIAYATNHTLNLSAELADVSNKDEGSGDWKVQEVKQMSWEATTENLYSVDGYNSLFTLMTAKTPITAVFAPKTETDINVPSGGTWTASSGYTGSVIINSISVNAQVGDYATFTVNFTGVGALTAYTPAG